MGYAKTLFIDIDGCLLQHHSGIRENAEEEAVLLPNVLEKFAEWDSKGYRIILVTGRRESERPRTEAQLDALGVFYDQLIMGLPRGQRVVINDLKAGLPSDSAAACVNIQRNSGLGGVDV